MVQFRMMAAVTLLAASALGAPASAPDAAEILRKANEAARKLTAISYEAEFFGEGEFGKHVPRYNGRVKAKRGAKGEMLSVFAEAMTTAPGSGQPTRLQFATDGVSAYSIDSLNRIYTSGRLADALPVPLLGALFPPRFLHDAPFRRELQGGAVQHQGVQTVGDALCDVIRVTYQDPGRPGAIFYLGKQDHLIRRIETKLISRPLPGAAGIGGTVVFSIRSLDIQPKLDETMFRLPCPDGFTKKTFQPRKPRGSPGLLTVGSEAPDWELKTPGGKTVRLKSLRGKVVVLDFWASWCGPCKMAMPGLQKLHDRFKGKPVAIFGVNCRERRGRGDPMAYIKKNGYTYGQLVEGDRVASAYGIRGIPTLYVIGPDGKILYVEAGFNPRAEAILSRIIEQALKP